MVTEDPVQVVWSGPASAVAGVITVMVTVLELTHPGPADSVKVYVVVEPGCAYGFETVEALNPVAGDQL
jgi:hypothetical protein